MALNDLTQRGDWPQTPAIYQVYPRSFYDSNGDGIGDLAGITQKLDHIASLGVDAVWLSPFYVSAWIDGGYDIVDHSAVDPIMGREADFDALIDRAHSLGLKVVIDQVLNHTSCEHPWFRAALRGCEDSAARYLFRDAKADGTPPNNWMSQFGQPGWEWVHRRDQYYFHQFLACQPSLDLRNPDVQAAHEKQIGEWRACGVDGFRFDAVSSYLWDDSLADNAPATPEVRKRTAGHYASPYSYQDHQHDMLPGDGAAYMENLRRWAGDDAWLFGEITSGNKSVEIASDFTGETRLDACYTTDLPENRAAPETVCDVLSRTRDKQALINWLSSHDQPRHLKGSGDMVAQAQVFAALMAFLPGPWLIYQGEDLGLPQPDLAKHEVTDPLDLMFWPDHPGREAARVPVPWNERGPGFGFTTGDPWLPMRWSVSHTAQTRVRETYRELLEARRHNGWEMGRVLNCEADGAYLEVEIETHESRYTGRFVIDGSPCDQAGTGTIAQYGDSSTRWHATIAKRG